MDFLKLIALYYYICECYDTELRWHCERFSNNNSPEFTDEELLTIYIFTMTTEEKVKVKSIHEKASKVRSTKGLIVHIFGRLAAAISLWVF
jgi:hypothetical protein